MKVVNILFNGDRPISADWESKSGEKGNIAFEWLIDASGRSGIISTQYLRNRRFTEALKNIAMWGYWRNGRVYMAGTRRENAPWFEALTGIDKQVYPRERLSN